MITLKTLEQATAQEVFDQVAAHLLKQEKACYSVRYHSCFYRYSELKCAAGSLIGDDEYSESFEGKTWFRLLEDNLVPEKHLQLIEELQTLHDGQAEDKGCIRINWIPLLQRFAKERDLTFEPSKYEISVDERN